MMNNKLTCLLFLAILALIPLVGCDPVPPARSINQPWVTRYTVTQSGPNGWFKQWVIHTKPITYTGGPVVFATDEGKHVELYGTVSIVEE